MSRSPRTRRSLFTLFALAMIAASRPTVATAQIIATPRAATASAGPRLPTQRAPQRTVLPGERSELRSRAATGTTIHLSTLAIVVGVVILLILLL
jgi:hypothetical protein